jgi:hypothetical protein
MNKYLIEHEIISLLKNYDIDLRSSLGEFTVEWIKFIHRDYQEWKWLIWKRWLAKAEIESENFLDARNIYFKKLSKIIPKISLIWQAYIDSQTWSILIKKWNKGYFHHIFNDNSVSLPFWKTQQNILMNLMENNNISEAFYYYWNELINTSWYLAKILIICAALDSLFPRKERNYWRIKILWEKLANDLYESWDKWLRHRLTHWEYFSPEDFQKNYVEEVHKKVIEYFNNEIITIDEKISLDTVNPQRHLHSNYKQAKLFLELKENISLKEILNEIVDNDLNKLESCKWIPKVENF